MASGIWTELMQTLLYGRILMASSLGIHILFALVGMGLPLFICIAEFIGIRHKDELWIMLARRWTMALLILFAVGTATGMVVGQELSLLWPKFMEIYGAMVALPFFIEVFAFFIEAIFLAIYVYAWDRFSNRWHHWFCSLPIVFGSMASGLLITIANAFMNSPAGFQMVHGTITNVVPLSIIFNPATPSEVLHTMCTAYLTVAFLLVSMTAWKLLRKQNHVYYQRVLVLAMIIGCITAIGTIITGDMSGKFVASKQPAKLAAMEAVFHTTGNAPEIVGGIVDVQHQRIVGGIPLPSLLSYLSYGDIHHIVQGLDAFPQSQEPSVFIHYPFEVMVGTGTYLLLLSCIFLAAWLLQRTFPVIWRVFMSTYGKYAMLIAGPLSFLAIECGWIVTEIGRQPWIVYHYMTVSEAITTSPYIGVMFWIFLPFFVLAAFGTVFLLFLYFKHHPLLLEREEHMNVLNVPVSPDIALCL